MNILGRYGKEDLAILYIAEIDGKIAEFVESLQPPIPREDKWVLIVSSLYGCPMKCQICDAGDYYHGKVSKKGLLQQIDYMVRNRYPNNHIPVTKFKVQFARMGEPALNEAVLEALRELPSKYKAPGLMPCLSTVAPNNAESFFEELLLIKDQIYPKGQFQLQFSVHSTDEITRWNWMTTNIWDLEEIQNYGEKWFKEGDRKITLNFAVASNSVIDPTEIHRIFTPSKFLIKLTPVNPTNQALVNSIQSGITEENENHVPLAQEFRKLGFQTLVSVGEWEENQIGSNCGQLASKCQNGKVLIKEEYTTNHYSIT